MDKQTSIIIYSQYHNNMLLGDCYFCLQKKFILHEVFYTVFHPWELNDFKVSDQYLLPAEMSEGPNYAKQTDSAYNFYQSFSKADLFWASLSWAQPVVIKILKLKRDTIILHSLPWLYSYNWPYYLPWSVDFMLKFIETSVGPNL